jgi:hypothetical protein
VYSVDKMMCSRRISLQGEDAVAKAGQRSALTSTFDTFTRSPMPSKLIVQLRLNANCGHQLPPRRANYFTFYVFRLHALRTCICVYRKGAGQINGAMCTKLKQQAIIDNVDIWIMLSKFDVYVKLQQT